MPKINSTMKGVPRKCNPLTAGGTHTRVRVHLISDKFADVPRNLMSATARRPRPTKSAKHAMNRPRRGMGKSGRMKLSGFAIGDKGRGYPAT